MDQGHPGTCRRAAVCGRALALVGTTGDQSCPPRSAGRPNKRFAGHTQRSVVQAPPVQDAHITTKPRCSGPWSTAAYAPCMGLSARPTPALLTLLALCIVSGGCRCDFGTYGSSAELRARPPRGSPGGGRSGRGQASLLSVRCGPEEAFWLRTALWCSESEQCKAAPPTTPVLGLSRTG